MQVSNPAQTRQPRAVILMLSREEWLDGICPALSIRSLPGVTLVQSGNFVGK
jgi:hypothetical protein